MKADTNPAYAYRDSCLRLLPSYCWYFAVSFKLRQKKPKHYSGKAASSYLDFAPIATKLFHYLLISLPLTAHWIFLPMDFNIWQKYLVAV